ncbi:hypothetical protein [Acaryochloris sp. IP29b_bin.137]|uniref:hypothetical protein n=1 Tax=Acaryochloris sp. IP29b_bin.137 TaxID=2969217 RepID=UPI00260966AD|nr:hypothetical protein [Acaryochloris sp. IP29b_bin.137]
MTRGAGHWILSLGSICALGLLSQPVWSQPSRPVGPIVARPFVHPTEKKVDYGLLIRAMRQFLANDRYLLKSELTLKANTPGASLISVAQIQTIAEEPNRFRTQITFINDAGNVGRGYLLVSDGLQVWTHDLVNNIYSVSNYQQFQDANDNFLSGMLSRLFSTIRNSAGKDNISLLVTVPEDKLVEILETKLAPDQAELKSDTQYLEGAKYTTYSYLDQTKGYQLQAFIDALTSEIKYLQIASQNRKTLNFNVQEKVIQYTNPSSVPADAFRFVPPARAKLQKTPISINPFLQ